MGFGFFDGFVNFMSGLGVLGRDKSVGSSYFFMPLDRQQLEAAYRTDWVARKVVDIPAQDATRAWRAWQADNADVEKIEDLEKKLDVPRKLKKALTLARLYGGSALIMGVANGKMSEELDIEKVKVDDLKFLHVVSCWGVTTGQLIDDLLSPYYGEPSYFQRRTTGFTTPDPAAKGKGKQMVKLTEPLIDIHPSRVVMFKGKDIPDQLLQGNANAAGPGWGDSILQAVYESVQDTTMVTKAVATLINETKFDIIKIPELSNRISTQTYRDRLTQRFMYANSHKSVINAVLLDKEEDWERINVQFAGLPDLMRVYLLIASGAADIPATRMLGQSAVGLNATGDADIRNYYDAISSEQEAELTPTINRLDEVLIRSALGSREPSIFYEWNSLWQMTDLEKSQIAKSKADTFKVDADVGIMDLEALRIGRQNQLIEDGTYPGLEQALEEQQLLDLSSMKSPEEQEQEEKEMMEEQAAQMAAKGGAPGAPGAAPKQLPFGAKPKALPAPGAAKKPFGDLNKDPDWTKGEGGKFTGSKGGPGEGTSKEGKEGEKKPVTALQERREKEQGVTRSGDPNHFRPSELSAKSEKNYHPQDRERFKALRGAWAKVNNELAHYIDAGQGDSKQAQTKIKEMKQVVKAMARLKADPGTFVSHSLPGGPRDVVIIGGGPAGLGAAVNSATEGLDALLVEAQEQTGGQAKHSSRIENYNGFAGGVTGEQLTGEMREQAERNGAQITTGVKVTGVKYDENTGFKTVSLSNGEEVLTRSVIVAGGVQFNKTEFPGSDGKGIIYGNNKEIAAQGKGKHVVIVGGSNGAAQAALGMVRKGKTVTILHRGSIEDSMSAKPYDSVRAHPKIKVIEEDGIKSVERDAKGTMHTMHLKKGGSIPAEVVGMFIGSLPETDWAPDEIGKDDKGRIKTERDLSTGLPGVFAAGDIREEGPGRVLASAGEGQVSVKNLFAYFSEEMERQKSRAMGESREEEEPEEEEEDDWAGVKDARGDDYGFDIEAEYESEPVDIDPDEFGPPNPRYDRLVDKLALHDLDNPFIGWSVEAPHHRNVKNRIPQRDFNPDPDWIKGEGGRFAGSRASSTFISPNIEEHITFEEASRGVYGERQRLLREASAEVDSMLGIASHTSSVVGAWSDGAEHSLMVTVADATPDEARASAAMKGYLGNQKQVLVFSPKEGGKEVLIDFSLDMSPAEAHKLMLANGVEFHTLEPQGDGTRVWVMAMDDATADAAVKVAEANGTKADVTTGSGEFIPPENTGSTPGEQRAGAQRSYAEVIERTLQPEERRAWNKLRNHWVPKLTAAREDPAKQAELKAKAEADLAEAKAKAEAAANAPVVEPKARAPRAPREKKAKKEKPRPADKPDKKPPRPPTPAEAATAKELYSRPIKGVAPGSHSHTISPRNVVSVKKPYGDSHGDYLQVDTASMALISTQLAANVKVIAENPSMYPLRPEGLGDKTVDSFKAFLKSNIRFLYSMAGKEELRAIDWYQNSRNHINGIAKTAGIPEHSAVAIYAALSPMTEWDKNVYMAERVIDIMSNHQNTPWDKEMQAFVEKRMSAKIQKAIEGKTLSQLTDPLHRAAWVRTYDEAHSRNPDGSPARYFRDQRLRDINPDGTFGEFRKTKKGENAQATWQSTEAIAKAVRIFDSKTGPREVIDPEMGNQHKVRSFYNALLNPKGLNGDVVIDTHAAAAAMLTPLSQNGGPVLHAFGGSPDAKARPPNWKAATSDSDKTGVSGTYGWMADAYREVAADLTKEGTTMLPHDLQAIVWNVKRDLFKIKMGTPEAAEVAKLWEEYRTGQTSMGVTQRKIYNYAFAHRERLRAGGGRPDDEDEDEAE